MENKPFIQNNWYWWETNDKYIWTQQWQILEARSVNINKSSKYFYSANWNLPDFEFEYDLWSQENIRHILFWNSFSDRLIFFSDWQIYNLSWLVIDIPKTIINAWVIWNKWFIINSDWSIWYWNYNASALDLWIWTWVSYASLWLSINFYFAPFITFAWKIFIASWSNIYIINGTLFTLETTVSLLSWWQARWISKIWDQFNIYLNYGQSSIQYIWDGVSDTVYNIINWYDKSILNIANINNIDYVVCEDWLYIADGYQPTCLYQRFFISEYTNAIETYRNKIFIPWYKCVYTYQFNKPWFPWNFWTELILPITTWNLQVSAMAINPKVFDSNVWKYTNDIFIAYLNYSLNNDFRNYVIQYSNDRFLNKRNLLWWWVRINPIIRLKWTKKEWKKIRLWYNLNTENISKSQVFTYNWITKTFYFKHSIWVFAEIDQQTKITCYIWDFTTKPTVWSIYSINWINWTITNVDYLFQENTKWHWWLELEMVETANLNTLEKSIWTITKVSWTWDTSGLIVCLYLWKIITVITDNSLNWRSIMTPFDFNEVIFTIHITEWLFTNYQNHRLQTRVYDFAFKDNDKQQDLI